MRSRHMQNVHGSIHFRACMVGTQALRFWVKPTDWHFLSFDETFQPRANQTIKR